MCCVVDDECGGKGEKIEPEERSGRHGEGVLPADISHVLLPAFCRPHQIWTGHRGLLSESRRGPNQSYQFILLII